jgi:hypothetical protein
MATYDVASNRFLSVNGEHYLPGPTLICMTAMSSQGGAPANSASKVGMK